MKMVFLREGKGSDVWEKYVATAEDLIKSLYPVKNQSELAIHKLKVSSEILVDLRKGLDVIGSDELEIDEFINTLNDYYEQVRAGNEVLLATPDEEQDVTPDNSEMQSSAEADQASEESLNDEISKSTTMGNSLDIIDDSDDFEPLSDELILGESVIEQPVASEAEIASDVSFGSISFDDDEIIEIDEPDVEEEIELAPVEEITEVEEANDEKVIDATSHDEGQSLDEFLSIVDTLSAGIWFTSHDGETETRCKLAAVIPTVGKYIFVNHSGRKVAEYKKEELAEAIRDKKLIQLEGGALFERALKTIVTNFQSKGYETDRHWT